MAGGMSRTERFMMFLYSTPNIVGCALGLIGLLLYFTGLIGDFWYLIVPGLYLIGVLLTPRRPQYELQVQSEFSAAEIRSALDNLKRKLPKRTPPEVVAKVDSIEESILSILPALANANGGAQNLYVVRQTAFEYLPKALENYLNLPPAFANSYPVRGGKTARQLLDEQLDLLDQEMKETVVAVSQNDTQKLLAHGRFLEDKFGRADILGDLKL
jgi:hypothetical protein